MGEGEVRSPPPAQAPERASRTMNPDYPVVSGHQLLTDLWAVDLPEPMNRRLEGKELVLWRRGFTVWLAAWNNDHGRSAAERAATIRAAADPAAFDFVEEHGGDLERLSYRLTESRGRDTVHALYGYVLHAEGHLQVGIYFDRPEDHELAVRFFRAVTAPATGDRAG